MAGFTTLALAGLAGGLGLFAASKKGGDKDSTSTAAFSRTRKRGDAPVTGTAKARESVGSSDQLGSPAPPDANLAASMAQSSAIAAADRARRRGATANSPLGGRVSNIKPATARVQRQTLLAK